MKHRPRPLSRVVETVFEPKYFWRALQASPEAKGCREMEVALVACRISGLETVLSRVDLELVRKAHFDRQACRNGSYYHSEAESMIGIAGLNNVQDCVTDCLRRGVPGDLLEAGVWRGGTTILMRASFECMAISTGKSGRRIPSKDARSHGFLQSAPIVTGSIISMRAF